MLKLAAKELGLDLEQCWMIGDDDRDILAGEAAGCRTIMIKQQGSELVRKGESKPDFTAGSPQEAANIVAHYGKQSKAEPKDGDSGKAGAVKTIQVGGASKALDEAEAKKNKSLDQATDEDIKADVDNGEVHEIEESPEELLHVSRVRDKVRGNKRQAEEYDQEPEKSGALQDEAATEDAVSQPERRTSDTNQLLQEVLRELKKHNIREEDAKAEFSGASLLAGVTQIIVILCLVMAYVATGGTETNYDKLQSWLLGGLIFQSMTIALLMMNNR